MCFHATAPEHVTPREAALMRATLVRVSIIGILPIMTLKHSQDHNVRLVSLATKGTFQQGCKTAAQHNVVEKERCSLIVYSHFICVLVFATGNIGYGKTAIQTGG